MATNSKEIRRRIKSTQSIKKITKAMELVSAAKMRKAQAQAIASRPYATLTSALLQNLAGHVHSAQHPLLNRVLPYGQAPSAKALVVLVTPNRGLAGALVSNLFNKSLEVIRSEGAEQISFVTVGKKGLELARRQHFPVVAQFDSNERSLNVYDAKPIAQIAIDEFLANRISRAFVVYADFVSTLTQKPKIIQLLPFERTKPLDGEEYSFEPSADEVWDKLIYRAVEFKVYQTLVEALASEHSARMVAMRNANEAAGELIDDLSLSYNQARQAGITGELSEISAAKLAMEG